MKKKTFTHVMLMILIGALLNTLTLLPVSARKPIFQASGTLDEYIAEGYDGARIVAGSWKVTINHDEELTFSAHYVEENINEEIPGTKDQFKLYYEEAPTFDIVGSTLTIHQGFISYDKKGWDTGVGNIGDPPGPRFFKIFQVPIQITIDSDNIEIVIDGQPYIAGTTHAFTK